MDVTVFRRYGKTKEHFVLIRSSMELCTNLTPNSECDILKWDDVSSFLAQPTHPTIVESSYMTTPQSSECSSPLSTSTMSTERRVRRKPDILTFVPSPKREKRSMAGKRSIETLKCCVKEQRDIHIREMSSLKKRLKFERNMTVQSLQRTIDALTEELNIQRETLIHLKHRVTLVQDDYMKNFLTKVYQSYSMHRNKVTKMEKALEDLSKVEGERGR